MGGLQDVEEHDIVTPRLDVVETCAVAMGVAGQVENVFGLMLMQVLFEQAEPLVAGLGQPELAAK